MEIADIEEALAQTPESDVEDSTFRRKDTHKMQGPAYIGVGVGDQVQTRGVDVDNPLCWSDEWDSTEAEESDDDVPSHPAIAQLDIGDSETIPILGSLCLYRQPQAEHKSKIEDQGIFQGLVMDQQERERMGILPRGLYMTQTLETFGSELEDMSVKVMRETDIVPQSPFDFNAATDGGGIPPGTRSSKVTIVIRYYKL